MRTVVSILLTVWPVQSSVHTRMRSHLATCGSIPESSENKIPLIM